MSAPAIRIGATLVALTLITVGLLVEAPWLAVMAVLVVVVAVALSR